MDKLDFGYYNMDCMAGMKLFPDKYFDVAIVDPPYGINAPNMAMGTNKSRTKNGYPSESTASRLKRSGQVKEWDSKNRCAGCYPFVLHREKFLVRDLIFGKMERSTV